MSAQGLGTLLGAGAGALLAPATGGASYILGGAVLGGMAGGSYDASQLASGAAEAAAKAGDLEAAAAIYAADKQLEAVRQSNALLKESWQTGRADMMPWMQAGQWGLNELQNQLATPAPFFAGPSGGPTTPTNYSSYQPISPTAYNAAMSERTAPLTNWISQQGGYSQGGTTQAQPQANFQVQQPSFQDVWSGGGGNLSGAGVPSNYLMGVGTQSKTQNVASSGTNPYPTQPGIANIPTYAEWSGISAGTMGAFKTPELYNKIFPQTQASQSTTQAQTSQPMTQPQTQTLQPNVQAQTPTPIVDYYMPGNTTDMAQASTGTSDPYAEFYSSPGYEFVKGEGEKAIGRNLAATGNYLSPQTGKALSEYNQGIASQEWDNYLKRYYDKANFLLSQYYNRLAPYQSLAGVGQTTASGLMGAGQAYGQNVGQNYLTGGNALAQGILGQGAAQAGGVLGSAQAKASGYANQANLWNNAIGQGTKLALMSKLGVFA